MTTKSMAISVLLGCLVLCGGCDKDPVAPPPEMGALVEITTNNLTGVPEPSGLALDTDSNHLWTVSDQTGSIYYLTTGGLLEATIDFGGQDLEGIAIDPTDGSLFVVQEALGQVLHLDREGNLLERLTPSGLPEMGGSGLEGITIDPRNGHIFILKEKNPGMLIEIDRAGVVLATHELDFAEDFAGLEFVTATNQLLIISDKSATLTWCTTTGQAIKTMTTGLEKGEGIALNSDGSVLYAISDSAETLTSYNLSE